MSETRRKKPAGINMDKLDGMFMPKGGAVELEPAPAPVPEASPSPPQSSEPRTTSRKTPAPAAREAEREVVYLPMPSHTAPVIPGTDEDLIITTIRYPRDVARQMDEWLSANPGHSKTSMLLNGLRALGIPIADEHLVPKRARGNR